MPSSLIQYLGDFENFGFGLGCGMKRAMSIICTGFLVIMLLMPSPGYTQDAPAVSATPEATTAIQIADPVVEVVEPSPSDSTTEGPFVPTAEPTLAPEIDDVATQEPIPATDTPSTPDPAVTEQPTDAVSLTPEIGTEPSGPITGSLLPASLQLSFTIGPVGSIISVSGYDFSPNEAVTVRWGNPDTGIVLAERLPITDANGFFTVVVSIPADAATETFGIYATDQTGNQAVGYFTVTPVYDCLLYTSDAADE